MITMNEPQVWTMIGVFSTVMIGIIAILAPLFMRTISSRFDGLTAQFTAQFTAQTQIMEAKFDAMGTKFDAVGDRIDGLKAEMVVRFEQVDQRFGRLEKQVDGLDGDVQAIARKAMPD